MYFYKKKWKILDLGDLNRAFYKEGCIPWVCEILTLSNIQDFMIMEFSAEFST